MGLNSSHWGAIAGTAVSAYSPQAGVAVSSLFQKKQVPVPVSQAVAAPPAPTVPSYVWVVGAVFGAAVIGFVLVKLTK